MSIALFLGRFQPVPHNGHVQVIQEIITKHDKVIIGIGSSQYSGTFENPLTFDERRQIFEALFQDLGVSRDRYQIVAITDIHNNDRYVDHVKKLVPAFNVVYSGNGLVQRLFEEKEYTVIKLPRYGGIEGTDIRTKMLAGDRTYRSSLPDAVLAFIDTWGVEDRVREAGVRN